MITFSNDFCAFGDRPGVMGRTERRCWAIRVVIDGGGSQRVEAGGMMAEKKQFKARDIMSSGVQCIGAHQSLLQASKMMRDLNVGCLPICGDDNRLKGLVTDRDIVVKCCAEGIDPATVEAGSLGGELYWIDAEAGASEALETMERHQIKRLPVIDVGMGHSLVGMITEADLARNLSDEQIAEFATRVYTTAG
jgi:CBS domain-containing protein